MADNNELTPPDYFQLWKDVLFKNGNLQAKIKLVWLLFVQDQWFEASHYLGKPSDFRVLRGVAQVCVSVVPRQQVP
jgi:hypothetical protein